MKQLTKSNILHNNFLLLSILLMFVCGTNSSAQDTRTLVNDYVQKYQNQINDGDLLKKILSLPANDVIEAFKPLCSDSVSSVRSIGFMGIYKAGIISSIKESRIKAVNLLSEALKDSDAGIVGNTADYLSEFNKNDFEPETRYNISMLAKSTPPHHTKIIKLTGWLGIDELIYNYKAMSTQVDKYSKSKIWAMQLAMARMNDKESISQVMAKARNLPVNDNVVFDIYPDLVYTMQKEAFDFLLDKILSDSKDCRSSNPDNEKPIICAFRIINYVAPYIDSFPVKTDISGTPIYTNYDKTLAEVRLWITTNKTNYQIKDEKY